jgi:hypothetical protein
MNMENLDRNQSFHPSCDSPILMLECVLWRDGRVDYGACLENRCGFAPTVGSNPSPSALKQEYSGRCQSG